METFDTNVLVRLLVTGDPSECDRAERAWRSALARDGVYIPIVVLVEVTRVLRLAYTFDRHTIVDALRRLCSSQRVRIENEAIVLAALRQFEHGSADFSDYIILETGRRAVALPVRTFNEQLAKSTNVTLV